MEKENLKSGELLIKLDRWEVVQGYTVGINLYSKFGLYFYYSATFNTFSRIFTKDPRDDINK